MQKEIEIKTGVAKEARVAKEDGASSFISDKIPRYYQLATLLREQIIMGQARVGDRFPSESNLASLFGVSRVTVRQALDSLEEEGLIQRAAGKGTFVIARPEFAGTLQMDGSVNGLISMGLATTVKLLGVQDAEVQPEETELWGLPVGSRLVRVERLRYYKDQPYCYILNRVPWEIGSRMRSEDWSTGSFLVFIRDKLQISLGDADANLRATLADATLSHWLEIRIGAPVLLAEYSIYSDDGRLLEKPSLYYRSELHSFTLHMRAPDKKSGKGLWGLRKA
jgi:GntR family transcriptional regulator